MIIANTLFLDLTYMQESLSNTPNMHALFLDLTYMHESLSNTPNMRGALKSNS